MTSTAANRVDTVRRTVSGVEYGLIGILAPSPAPTLLVLSGTIDDAFTPHFQQAARLLVPRGWLAVAIDLPCHGSQRIAGRPDELAGWAEQMRDGDDPVGECCARMSAVLDELVTIGLTDPDRIIATGTSRAGFMALRYTAFDPRVRAVVGYAPVTDLRRLHEFDIAAGVTFVDEQSLPAHVAEIAPRPVFLVIGDVDERVDTDDTIALARQLTAAGSPVELHVLHEPGGHTTPPGAAELAADWIVRQTA